MIEFQEEGNLPDKKINIYIGEEEWQNYSYQNKLRLLYRLQSSRAVIANELKKPITLLMEEEQRKREIDFEATLKKIEEGDI